MKKIIVIVVLFTLALSCKNNPVPSDAIKKETFINILVDIHIAEGIYYEQMRIKYDSLGSTSMYLSILEKYKVSEKEMLITTKYYSQNQREYKKIYTEVVDKISMMIEEANNQMEVEISVEKNDSTNVEVKVN